LNRYPDVRLQPEFFGSALFALLRQRNLATCTSRQVLTVPGRDLVPPPQLAAYAPVLYVVASSDPRSFSTWAAVFGVRPEIHRLKWPFRPAAWSDTNHVPRQIRARRRCCRAGSWPIGHRVVLAPAGTGPNVLPGRPILDLTATARRLFRNTGYHWPGATPGPRHRHNTASRIRFAGTAHEATHGGHYDSRTLGYDIPARTLQVLHPIIREASPQSLIRREGDCAFGTQNYAD